MSKRSGQAKIKKLVGSFHGYRYFKSQLQAHLRIMFRSNSSQKYQQQRLKVISDGDDELVKHMSNLPAYLRRAEKKDNIQEKALNVGVLNWSRLENWTHKHRHNHVKGGMESSRGIHSSAKQKSGLSTLPTVVRGGTPQLYSSFGSNLISSKKDDLPKSVNFSGQNVSRVRESEIASRNDVKGQRRIPSTYTPLERNHSSVMNEKQTRKLSEATMTTKMVNVSSKGSNAGGVLQPKGKMLVRDGELRKKTERLMDTEVNRKYADGRTIIEVEETSSKLQNDIALGSEENMSALKTKKILNLPDIDINLSLRHSPGKQGNVVHLAKQINQSSNSEALHLQPTSFDEYFSEENSSSGSDFFSSEMNHSTELSPDIPMSSLPSLSEPNVMLDVIKTSLGGNGMDACSPSQHSNAMTCLVPISNLTKNSTSEIKHTHLCLVNKSETLDRDTPEFGARKGRHPSPNRRFSFSLSQIGRSFSFKEGSTVPQLSSTYVAQKSGPVNCETSAGLNNLDRKSVGHTHSRARSSPLRRLIEPIMKYKAASQVNHVEGNLNSFNFFSKGVRGSSQKKHLVSTVQALMQLTVKNGIPLFKFIVDGSSNILAATIKSSTSSEDDSFGKDYTFYFVDEIKKKSGGLIRQGSKEKNNGYVYNVIGQMKVASSHCFDLIGRSSGGLYKLCESVLFGVEAKPRDHDSPKVVSSKELAAVVFKIPIHKMSKYEQPGNGTNLMKCLNEDRGISNSRERSEKDSIVVILPGGVHGSPCNGEPSTLIDRWRSDGSCDCGGWDVGCKLHILLNQQNFNDAPTPPKAHSITRHFELFSQEGGAQNKPIFSLAFSQNGSFSIEFSSTMSPLQAFFISVVLISYLNHSEASTVTRQLKFVKEPHSNSSEEPHPKAPAIFTPIPPLSPVGRV